jgi:hypothetical protein
MTPAERRFHVLNVSAHIQAITVGMATQSDYLAAADDKVDLLLQAIDIHAARAPKNCPAWFPSIIPNYDLLVLGHSKIEAIQNLALGDDAAGAFTSDAANFRLILSRAIDLVRRERMADGLPADSLKFESEDGATYIGFPSSVRKSVLAHFGLDCDETEALLNAVGEGA